ncbi:unnamed protein product, partial [Oppiella nova]
YVGTVNPNIGMAEVLRDTGRYHCVFAVTNDWKSRLESIGFEVRLIGQPVARDATTNRMGSAESNYKEIEVSGVLENTTQLENAIRANEWAVNLGLKEITETDPLVKAIIEDLKPDVIISDLLIQLPSIYTSGIPWIFSWSANPLSLNYGYPDDILPPAFLGLPTNSGTEVKEKYRQQVWERRLPTNSGTEVKEKYRQQVWERSREKWYKYRDQLVSMGCPKLQEFLIWTPSPYANIYMTPKELDYTDIRPLPDNFHGFDNFKRTENEDTFEIPECLKNRSGKLIYLSLGSIGSGNAELMKRLVAILSKSKHRFIVSKGVNHEKYSLADNMWGERSVPQVKVLSVVDLMITHGGNNSVTETMYFGKPMVVLPLFGDQYDNAQRVQEKGFGIRLNPYECSENELLDSIDRLLNDEILAQKLAKVVSNVPRDRGVPHEPYFFSCIRDGGVLAPDYHDCAPTQACCIRHFFTQFTTK